MRGYNLEMAAPEWQALGELPCANEPHSAQSHVCRRTPASAQQSADVFLKSLLHADITSAVQDVLLYIYCIAERSIWVSTHRMRQR